MKSMVHTFTKADWNNKLNGYDGICPSCHRKRKLGIDHIVPISLVEIGHVYTINDVQALCQSCNAKKGLKTIRF